MRERRAAVLFPAVPGRSRVDLARPVTTARLRRAGDPLPRPVETRGVLRLAPLRSAPRAQREGHAPAVNTTAAVVQSRRDTFVRARACRAETRLARDVPASRLRRRRSRGASGGDRSIADCTTPPSVQSAAIDRRAVRNTLTSPDPPKLIPRGDRRAIRADPAAFPSRHVTVSTCPGVGHGQYLSRGLYSAGKVQSVETSSAPGNRVVLDYPATFYFKTLFYYIVFLPF